MTDLRKAAQQATPRVDLLAELMDSNEPKTEREHAAVYEIERLRAALARPDVPEAVSADSKNPRDKDDVPLERAVLVREWKAMRLALSTPRSNPYVPEGWVLVPVEPTEKMWGELARDIIMWIQMTPAPLYGSKLHTHLTRLGKEIPDWLAKEIPNIDHTPSKGTVATCIYKAMLAAAQKGGA